MIIYRAYINCRDAEVERISIESKEQLVRLLNYTNGSNYNLDDQSDEMPVGYVFSQNKKGILQEVKRHFKNHGFSLGRCTIEFKSNMGEV